jgi:hypothetical protein
MKMTGMDESGWRGGGKVRDDGVIFKGVGFFQAEVFSPRSVAK